MTNSLSPRASPSAPAPPPSKGGEGAGPDGSEAGDLAGSSLFRRQALEAHGAGQDFPGSPLRISPRWVRYVYPLLLTVLVSVLLFVALGSVGEYAEGTAFVLLRDGADPRPPTVAAVFPGQVRPLLGPGMPVRFELSGFRGNPETLTIAKVEERVLSVAEAGTLLGLDLVSSGELRGPLVVTYSPLPGERFEADGRTLSYHQGLRGRARVRLGTRRILPALLPALEPLFGDDER